MLGALRQDKPDCPGGVSSGRGAGLLVWLVPVHHGEESFRAWFGIVNKGVSAQEVTAVVAAWQNGALSRDSMLDIFRRGEVLPEGRSNEEEMRLVGKSGGPQQVLGGGQVVTDVAGGQV